MKTSQDSDAVQSDRRVRKYAQAKSERAASVQSRTGAQKPANEKKSSHWFRNTLICAYVLGIIWTSRSSAAEFRVAGRPVRASIALLRGASVYHGPLAIRAYVQKAAKAEGVNPRIAEWIVSHESRHRPNAIGDGGESRGLWQINKAWHPEVSDQCAYDVTCSTHWSLERIHSGYAHEWSTWKYCREKFGDCPFKDETFKP